MQHHQQFLVQQIIKQTETVTTYTMFLVTQHIRKSKYFKYEFVI